MQLQGQVLCFNGMQRQAQHHVLDAGLTPSLVDARAVIKLVESDSESTQSEWTSSSLSSEIWDETPLDEPSERISLVGHPTV